MNDPFMVLILLEAVLFIVLLAFLFGGKKISPKEKRTGFAIFIAWLVVLAVIIIWGIVRMLLTIGN